MKIHHIGAIALAAAMLAAVGCGEKKLYPTGPEGSSKPGIPSQPEDDSWKAPDKLFGEDYFQKFTDPSSGVVSYYLKSEVLGKDNSQSNYYNMTEMTDDERFLFAECSTNEWSGKPQERVGIIIDLATREMYTVPGHTGCYSLLDPVEDKFYYCIRTTDKTNATFYRRDLLTNPSSTVSLASFPKSILPSGQTTPIWRSLNHITLTSDKRKVFIDPRIVDVFYWGLLDLYTGEWEEWGRSSTENVTHGQLNPRHDDEALCAIDTWSDSHKVDHPVVTDPDGTCRRMQFIKKGSMTTIKPGGDNSASHEGWTADGDHVYYCSHGINVINLRTGEYQSVFRTDYSKESAAHCHPSKDMSFWTFDDNFPDFYRGGRWKVRFLNAKTGKHAYIYSQLPAITSKDKPSELHPDPHPHFVCNDKYIICTMASEDGNIHLSVTPVDQLIEMTN